MCSSDLQIFEYAQSHTLQETADKFKCHINTVKKIKRRGKMGDFETHSRAPKSTPRKTSTEVIDKIIEARKKEGLGSEALKEKYDLEVSPSTIYRHLKKEKGLIKEQQKEFKPLEKFYFYIKKLTVPISVVRENDEKETLNSCFVFYIVCHESQFVFSAISTGSIEKTPCPFVVHFFEHLKKQGIKPSSVILNTSLNFEKLTPKSIKISNMLRKLIYYFYGARHNVFKSLHHEELLLSYFQKMKSSINDELSNEDILKMIYDLNKHHNIKCNKASGNKLFKEVKSLYELEDLSVIALMPIHLTKR